MTDLEMLEAVAKITGMRINFGAVDHGGRPYNEDTGLYWNTLDDDGDAMRLCVARGYFLSVYLGTVTAGHRMLGGDEATEPLGDDKCKATRRAITRAAAGDRDK